jgi:hypothetical protein
MRRGGTWALVAAWALAASGLPGEAGADSGEGESALAELRSPSPFEGSEGAVPADPLRAEPGDGNLATNLLDLFCSRTGPGGATPDRGTSEARRGGKPVRLRVEADSRPSLEAREGNEAAARARWVIDRIAEEVAVIVGAGGTRIVPRAALGPEAREGDVLDERLVPDPEATAAARERVARLRARLVSAGGSEGSATATATLPVPPVSAGDSGAAARATASTRSGSVDGEARR